MSRNGLLHLILLFPLIGGVALMGFGLGDEYLASSKIASLPAAFFGLAICILTGLAVARLHPSDTGNASH